MMTTSHKARQTRFIVSHQALTQFACGWAVINFVTSKCYIHLGNDSAMFVKSGCAIA